MGDKWILAQAMRPLLPVEVLNREEKGRFNEPVFRGLMQAVPRLERLIQRSCGEAAEFVRKDILLEGVQSAALGVSGDASIRSRLDVTLSLLLWLQKQEQWRNEPGPMAEVVSARLPLAAG